MTARVLLLGTPNSGKSTLFNALTGGAARTANFPGTTVDVEQGTAQIGGVDVALLDVPGAFSLAPRSPEEQVAAKALLGEPAPDVVVVVLDAPRLQRSLYLASQILDLGLPTVIAVNLMDEARAVGRPADVEGLAKVLGCPVVGTAARSGEGVQALRAAIGAQLLARTPCGPVPWPLPPAAANDLEEVARLVPDEGSGRKRVWAQLALLSGADLGRSAPFVDEAVARRERAQKAGRDLDSELIGARYAWVDSVVPAPAVDPAQPSRSDAIDRVLLHPLWGGLSFALVMSFVFWLLFAGAEPLVALVEAGVSGVASWATAAFDRLGDGEGVGLARDFVVNGLIAGVGGVAVFLPQVALLFGLIAVLEDVGYLARAAQWMDRLLRSAGLPGSAFVPLLSGFACAVPAILATRTMPRFRDRLLTMVTIPLASCSARLPVYTLVIAALVPAEHSWERPLALGAMYALSTVVTLVATVVLGRFVIPGHAISELIELPPYRAPVVSHVARAIVGRVSDFVNEAGRIIVVASVLLWALLAFPRQDAEVLVPPAEHAALVGAGADIDALVAQRQLEQSFGGRLGKAMEPVIAPLGMDWQIGVGLVGAFAAREVFVATLAIVHGVAGDDVEGDLAARLAPNLSIPAGASIMVFFALSMQCLSTLAVLRKETGGWRWPAAVFAWMTALAWCASWLTYQGLGALLG